MSCLCISRQRKLYLVRSGGFCVQHVQRTWRQKQEAETHGLMSTERLDVVQGQACCLAWSATPCSLPLLNSSPA